VTCFIEHDSTVYNSQPSPQGCSQNSYAFNSKYRKQAFYPPLSTEPLIELKITVHIIDPTGQIANDTNIMYVINNALAYFNDGLDRYSYTRTATYSGTFTPPFTPTSFDPNLMDSRLRYRVTNVYFYNNIPNDSSSTNNYYLSTINSLYPGRVLEGLPIVYCRDKSIKGGMTMSTQWPNSKSVRAYYPDTTFNLSLRPHIAFSQYNLIRHEIAHCYDLRHLYTDSGSIFLTTCEELSNNYCTTSEYLSDVFATGYTSWNSCGVASEGKFAGITFSSNNVMGFESNYAWMSPLQMSRRTKNMYLDPKIRIFASNMAADTANPWVVDTNEVWDFDIQMYRNIVVDSGATLTIKCKVAMPAEGKIIVKKGAKLFIDGGLVTGWNTAVNTTTLSVYRHQRNDQIGVGLK